MIYTRLSALLFILSLMVLSAPLARAQTFYGMNFSETNMRTGNSKNHPILAVYGQRGTPFEILSVLYPDMAYSKVAARKRAAVKEIIAKHKARNKQAGQEPNEKQAAKDRAEIEAAKKTQDIDFQEFAPSWYRVRDFEGQTGWIKSNQLGSKRTLIVVGIKQVTMYAKANHHRPIALLPERLVVRKKNCVVGWCNIAFTDPQYGKLEGWVSREYLWGNMASVKKKD